MNTAWVIVSSSRYIVPSPKSVSTFPHHLHVITTRLLSALRSWKLYRAILERVHNRTFFLRPSAPHTPAQPTDDLPGSSTTLISSGHTYHRHAQSCQMPPYLFGPLSLILGFYWSRPRSVPKLPACASNRIRNGVQAPVGRKLGSRGKLHAYKRAEELRAIGRFLMQHSHRQTPCIHSPIVPVHRHLQTLTQHPPKKPQASADELGPKIFPVIDLLRS